MKYLAYVIRSGIFKYWFEDLIEKIIFVYQLKFSVGFVMMYDARDVSSIIMSQVCSYRALRLTYSIIIGSLSKGRPMESDFYTF